MKLLHRSPAVLYLFCAVDSGGQTEDFYLCETHDREAAKCYLKRFGLSRQLRSDMFARDRLRSDLAAIREQNVGQLCHGCRHRTRRYANSRIEPSHRHAKRRWRAMQDPRTTATGCAIITRIEVYRR